MPRWTVSFRFIPPYMAHVPVLMIPIERMSAEAETEEQAWPVFLTMQQHPDWFRKEETACGGNRIPVQHVEGRSGAL
jgi:hypothetical protein